MGESGQVQKILSWGLIHTCWTLAKDEKKGTKEFLPFLSCLSAVMPFLPSFFGRHCLNLDSI